MTGRELEGASTVCHHREPLPALLIAAGLQAEVLPVSEDLNLSVSVPVVCSFIAGAVHLVCETGFCANSTSLFWKVPADGTRGPYGKGKTARGEDSNRGRIFVTSCEARGWPVSGVSNAPPGHRDYVRATRFQRLLKVGLPCKQQGGA
jgi:hypothetical protein